MGNLSEYKSFEDKIQIMKSHCLVREPKELEKIISEINSDRFIYRGVNESRYKCYSSAQRNYLDQTKFWQRLGKRDYHEGIKECINRAITDNEFMEFFTQRYIPINDFLILSVLQHYLNFSPLIDFSLNIYEALYFATDGAKLEQLNNDINDFISLYYIDKTIDWIRATLQSVHSYVGPPLNDMLKEYFDQTGNIPGYKEVIKEFEHLTYERNIDGFDFISIGGPEVGITSVSIPFLGFNCSYKITNPRIEAQDGLFIFNPTSTIPLWERINNNIDSTRNIINCIEIHKSLIPYIQKEYLEPNNINEKSVYVPNEDSIILENIINKIFNIS